MRPALIVAVALLGTAAACAPARAPWSAAGVSPAETASEWEDCKRQARYEIGAADGVASPRVGEDRRTAGDRERRIIESCMRVKGFTPKR
ncbi:hypothetical protein ACM64Y_03690 [Novispirillum sp. DQ9]|uniref:hypothetical protein n=1 Tax=Novispirillum sp. DQ9 TaxID=3398612 RepID=UPI003C79BB2A